MKQQIGLAGLAVMGENLVLNIESRGFSVSVFNRTYEKTARFVNGRAEGRQIFGFEQVEDFVNSLESPRKIIMMIKAGDPVDLFIEQLLPYLDTGDIVIDGGNSDYHDTIRRFEYLESKGLLYIGAGVSGGEEGALKGPSIMPGGSAAAWEHVKPVFLAAAGVADDGQRCCAWMGPAGAGHFVKMVHNGIEYGDMQLICEIYHLMRSALGLTPEDIHAVFRRWNKGKLSSYLIEITAEITGYKDEHGDYLLDKILDAAGQKGTGKWTVINALEEGTPLSLISESVFARCLSSLKEQRMTVSRQLSGPETEFAGQKDGMLADLEKALYAAKLISYAQGFGLMQAVSDEKQWGLDMGEIARIWRAGCIIRSAFLDDITKGYQRDGNLDNLLLDPYFKEEVIDAQRGLRSVIGMGVAQGIPMPCLSAALAYYDGLRSERLPANLLQAQRDYFGAHMYERVDRPRGEWFHTNWTGEGGDTTSTAYSK